MTGNIMQYLNVQEMKSFLSDYFASHSFSESARALEFACRKHSGQFRKEGTAYIVHPLTISLHMISLGVKEDNVIAAALLHDVCEDCGVPFDELPVNSTVRHAVKKLTFIKKKGEDRRSAKKRYFEAMYDCREACIVKAFDRCNNISTMALGFSPEKTRRYIDETVSFLYPLIDHIRTAWPEYGNVCFCVRYQMDSVINSLGGICTETGEL